jgi:TolB protein
MKRCWRSSAALAVTTWLLFAVPSSGHRVSAPPAFRLSLVASDAFGGGDASLAPDGRRFVISSRRSGNWELWVYDIDRSAWTQLTHHEAEDHEGQWSPDGRQIVFTSTRAGSKDVWTLALEGGALERLTRDSGDEEYPAWSPDARAIVYTGGPWKHRDFLVVGRNGGAPRAVTPRAGHVGACSFVPDGRSLVCHGYESGTGDVLRLPLRGGQAQAITSGASWDYKPTVAPRHGWVAYSRSDEGPSGIWLQALDGTGGAFPLLDPPTPYDDRWPTWDASGSRLLFHRFVEQGTAVRVLDLATGRLRTLSADDENPGQAALDPEGERVVYSAWERGRPVLRIRAVDGGDARTVAVGSGWAAFPRFSPDGQLVAFAYKPTSRSRWELATVASQGGVPRIWTETLAGVRGLAGPIDWSPDGRRLVFKADTAPFESDIFTLDLSDGAIRNLTRDEWFDEAPSWAPDGRSVVFMSTRGGDWTWGLFRLHLGGEVEPLTSADHTEKNFPRLSASGDLTFTRADEHGVERAAVLRRDGSLDILPAGDANTRWPSLSRDGTRLLFTAIDRRVEYWLAENVFVAGRPAWPSAKHAAPPLPSVLADATERGAAAAFWARATQVPGTPHEAGVVASPKRVHHR